MKTAEEKYEFLRGTLEAIEVASNFQSMPVAIIHSMANNALEAIVLEEKENKK